MGWNHSVHPAVTIARLMSSSAEVVYEELRRNGESYHNQWFAERFDELEAALYSRGDRLINLGLAQYGSSFEVLWDLYQIAYRGTEDKKYDKGVRLACLGNQVFPLATFGDGYPPVHFDELRRLAREGDDDEVSVLMANPSARGVLRDVYLQKEPFSELANDQWAKFVHASQANPGMNVDRSNIDGPDLVSWDIQKGIYYVLTHAPVEPHWVRVLYGLLHGLTPRQASAQKENILEVLERWSEVKVMGQYSREHEEENGWYTDLSYVEEFKCLVAALYGRQYDATAEKIVYVGRLDSDDIVCRCAYYGNMEMSAKEIRAAYELDGDVFVFAALANDSMLLNSISRKEIEDLAIGDLRGRYTQRCKQVAYTRPKSNFDPRPLADQGDAYNNDVDDDDELSRPNEELQALQAVSDRIAGLQKKITRIAKSNFWGFWILLAALIYFRS